MNYVIADNYLCLFALLEMILKQNNVNISQYELAEKAGITVPDGYKTEIKNVKYSSIQNDYGVAISTSLLQEIFDDVSVDIHVSYLDGLHTDEVGLTSVLRKRLAEGQYVILTFSYGVLYNKEQYADLGHASLLKKVLDEDWIQIYDPGPDSPGIKDVRISDMYEAMRKKGGAYFLD